ncbi:hypothetical protein L1049_022980 [Liquidambar formosana]|uniref:GATA-type domain-containing protein n=1 Tax=Liquidambar formosana TaxID=63359 RepID=A0AAP0RDA9_LIQFO
MAPENEPENENGTSMKWMSSKMRLMRKMMNVDRTGAEISTNTGQKFGDQKQTLSPLEAENGNNNSFNNINNPIRVCADCNTTKTPLWRSGPRGPKSLCNACGIRQRKARRAMAAAAAAANGTIIATDHTTSMKTKVQHKDKKSGNGHAAAQHKKRFKHAGGLGSAPSRGRKKICFEDFTISLSKNSAFQRVFPQDEKEAAILLMALSYGLVHG